MDDVLGSYLEENAGLVSHQAASAAPREWGTREVYFSSVSITDRNGTPRRTFRQGEGIRVAMEIGTRENTRVNGIILGFSIHRLDGETVAASNNLENGQPLITAQGPTEASINITPEIVEPGNYLLSISLTGNDTDYHWQDYFYPLSLLGQRKEPPLRISSITID